MNVVMTWGMYKGRKGVITQSKGKKNIVVRIDVDGVEFEIAASIDHVKKDLTACASYVAKLKTGKVTHVATSKGVGSPLITCGAGLNGTWRGFTKVGEVINAETVTCKKCREKYGLNRGLGDE